MKSFFRKIHPLLVFFLFAGMLPAQETIRMTLQDAIQYAWNQSLTIKNAQIMVADADEQISERLSTGLPQITGNVRFQRYLEVPKQPLPDQFVEFLQQLNPNGEVEREASFFLKNNLNASIDLDAMIFEGTFFVGLKAAKSYRQYVQQELQVRQREVKNNVIDAYLPVLLLQKNIELIGKNIANLEKLLFETGELYKAGFAEQLDVDRQELSLTNLRIEKENLERQKELALSALKFSINFPVDQPLEVAENLEEMIVDASDADLASAVDLNARPEILLAELGKTLSEINVNLQRVAYLPSLRAFGTYQQSYQGNNREDGFWAPATFVGLSLSIPIFDGLYKKSQVQRARLSLETTNNDIANLQRSVRLEVHNARTDYFNARRRLEGQQRNLDLAARIYETTQIKYREGVGSSLEITQAEQSLYTTQSNYLQALFDLLVAKANLDKALGK